MDYGLLCSYVLGRKKQQKYIPPIYIRNTNQDTAMPIITKESDIKNAMNDDAPLVLRIHATWCGHCTALAPIWDKIQQQQPHSKCRFVSIESSDLDNYKGMLPAYEGFPSLFIKTRKGNFEKYDKERSEVELSKWINDTYPKSHNSHNSQKKSSKSRSQKGGSKKHTRTPRRTMGRGYRQKQRKHRQTRRRLRA